MSEAEAKHAIESAFLTRVTLACENHVARLESMDFKDLEKQPIDAYAATVLFLFDKLCDALDANKRFPPERTRCGWCVRAAGGDQAAWDAAPWLKYPDEVVAHALICEHNPPVERLRAAEAEVARLTDVVKALRVSAMAEIEAHAMIEKQLEAERDRAVASAEFWQDRASKGGA